jgi:hypothetical protein
MNTPKLRYSFQTARPPRPVRRLLWTSALTAGAILAACVAARADSGMSPTGLELRGVCEGLQASGIDQRRPIAVTAVQHDGTTKLFRCDPTADGRWLPPVSRTVRWAF